MKNLLKPARFGEIEDLESLMGWVRYHLLNVRDFSFFVNQFSILNAEVRDQVSEMSITRNQGKWTPDRSSITHSVNLVEVVLGTCSEFPLPVARRHWCFVMDENRLMIRRFFLLTDEMHKFIKFTEK
jgi:hypothetical protein